MADVRNLSAQELERQNQLLKERDQIEQRIEERNKRIAVAGQEEIKRLKKRNEEDKTHAKNLNEELKTLKEVEDKAKDYTDLWEEAAEKQEDFWKTSNDFASAFAKMTPEVKKYLTDSNTGGNQFAAITARILSLKKQEINAEGDELEAIQERRKALEGIRSTQIDAAEALATEKENVFGITDSQKRRHEFQASILGMNEEDRKLSEQIFQSNENLLKQQERLVELQKQQDQLVGALPEGLQSALTVVKDLIKGIAAGLGPIVILGAVLAAALSEFTAIEEAAGKFREDTGLTKSNTKEIAEQAKTIRADFAALGVTAEDYYDTIKAVTEEFGDTARFSNATVASIVVLNKNFSVAQKDAAAVNMVFQSMAGLSAETAQNVSMQLADLANMAGVAPKQVFADIAESAEEANQYFRGDINALYKAAIEARRLGTNLKGVLKTAEGLLDFETGIEKELVAATFVSGQFNLSRARALAYAGKEADAHQEILRQLQRSGDFRDKDMFTQKALADATNMTVGEITKQLTIQDRLNSATAEQKKLVSEAMDKGLDITALNEDQLASKVKELEKQEEIVDKVKQLENSFQSVVAQVGGALMPILEALAPVLQAVLAPITWAAEGIKMVVDGLKQGSIAAYVLVGVLAKLYIKSIASAIAAIFTGFGAMGPFGVALAGLAVAGLLSKINQAKQVGDMAIDAGNSGGKARITTAEGGIFEPSGNDQIAVGPGVLNRLESQNRMANAGGVQTGGLSANNGVTLLINEVKKLREDMGSGKIKANAFLDGMKITSGITNVSENSTRNNFSYGQR